MKLLNKKYLSNKKSKGKRKQNRTEMHFTAMPQINRMTAPAGNEAARTELSVPGLGGGGGEMRGFSEQQRAAGSCCSP